ncbi:hypothetical protein ACFO25_06505 [Paenactinomyces guangxiensis]|uniref:Uncharacterized protein n=1 Tax=Paenactinomyces guangxiensis TaxID=1490290 RepID=A0A7W2A7M9_9BACL|nr:hypothetical protein [Paenactinomyces guangxiensis]MBA4493294.1 hypothetical protein [Paenactinomyces guangxiensis]MBH8589855.1 hypothetical protein [Paenactinomyces guangxiensis]
MVEILPEDSLPIIPTPAQFTEYKGIGQVDTLKAIQGKLYMGVYPGANIFSYDQTQPWNYGKNPISFSHSKAISRINRSCLVLPVGK